MIALNETNEYAAEIPFFLADVNNPTQGVTGHTFVLGEVQIKLPGETWADVPLLKIIELDYGWYCIRLTASQCDTVGEVGWRVKDSAVTPTFQPGRGAETISTLGGEIPQNGSGYLMFYLPDENDPIYADPITGASPTVQIRLPNGAFTAGDNGLVVEFGEGLYGYPLDVGDTVLKGKAFIYATATGAQPYSGYRTILGVGAASESVVTPTPIPVNTTDSDLRTVGVYKDLITGAVNRLCEYSKSGNFEAEAFLDNVG